MTSRDIETNTYRLTTLAVSELKGKQFIVPSYQRGYRWEADQVRALLEDLDVFEKNAQPGQFYCLQPLVVSGDAKDGTPWEVVDGQQRLTTLYLILRELNNGTESFQIRYERHSEDLHGLLNNEGNSPKTPDLFFLRSAQKEIKKWLEEGPARHADFGRSLRHETGACAKFIWQQVAAHKEAIRSFIRLNGGKIKLRDAELIRALFLMQRSGGSGADRQRIALRWDEMERRLQDPEFWAFLCGDKSTPDCRIEWLLRLTAPKHCSDSNSKEHAVFEWFQQELEERSPEHVWAEVDAQFSILEEWFEDNTLYHLTGFLIRHSNSRVRELIDLAARCSKDHFRRSLKNKIREAVFKNCTSDSALETFIDKLQYGNSEIKTVLLLLNLATLERDQTQTVRFSFHKYQIQAWDIEHIHATASRQPKDKPEFQSAFGSLIDYYERRDCREQCQDIQGILEKIDQVTVEALRESYEKFIKEFIKGDAFGDSDHIGNLTLLDAGTNRGFGNVPFALKRDWILQLDPSQRYILPCTLNVFTKTYSKDPAYLLHWTESDASDYQASLKQTLTAFFADSWESTSNATPMASASSNAKKESPVLAQAQLQGNKVQGIEAQVIRASFLDLFVQTHFSSVEIPLIQRDYAQGRVTAERVRTAFLHAIRDSLSKPEPLHLDFVYGEVHKGRFQPIDGQQRLTTLFLLHWFLANQADQMGDFRGRMRDANGQPKFRYAVRQSSQLFFNHLLDLSVSQANQKILSDIIRNQPWFRAKWRHDPTIAGALVMIDAMVVVFKDADVGSLYARLTSSKDSPISLEVLDLGSVGQAEEIYIKMNARGKELTGFERFKAWLMDVHEELDWPVGADLPHQWKLLLDGPWLDLFWHFSRDRKTPAEQASMAFLRTFLALAVNFRASTDIQWDPTWLQQANTDDPATWKGLVTRDGLTAVFEHFECLSARGNGTPELKALRARLLHGPAAPFDGKCLLLPFFEEPNANLTLKHRLWLHATCLGMKAKWSEASQAENHWYRVVRNLLEHSTLTSESFGKAVSALGKLFQIASSAGSILRALSDIEMKLEVLNREQLNEEIRKAKLILAENHGREWERAIPEAETQAAFHGQIELLLPETDDFSKFTHRSSIAKRLWNNEGSRVGRGDLLLVRAILARCDDLNLASQDRIHLTDSIANWRTELGRQNGWSQFRDGTRKILDELPQLGDIESFLREIIRKGPVSAETWRRNLIDHGHKLMKGSRGKIQNYRGHGVFVYRLDNSTEGDILIDQRATLRNHMIRQLLDTKGWSFLSGAEDWRQVQIDKDLVFYRGHHIPVRKSFPGRDTQDPPTVQCTFEYAKLTFRVLLEPNANLVEIAYPSDDSFQTLRQSLRDRLLNMENESKELMAAVEELMEVCVTLPELKPDDRASRDSISQ